jgi:hypothetical protein
MLVMAYKPLYALDPTESAALVQALLQQCTISPRFRKYVEKLLSGTGSASLVVVVGIIAIRRVARADVLPLSNDGPLTGQQVDNMLGMFLQGMNGRKVTSLNVEAPA